MLSLLEPGDGDFSGFGYDAAAAISAAKELNLAPGRSLVDKVLRQGKSFSDFLTHFRDDILLNRRINGHPMSEHTLAEYRRIIRHLDEKFGKRSMQDI